MSWPHVSAIHAIVRTTGNWFVGLPYQWGVDARDNEACWLLREGVGRNKGIGLGSAGNSFLFLIFLLCFIF